MGLLLGPGGGGGYNGGKDGGGWDFAGGDLELEYGGGAFGKVGAFTGGGER